MLDPLAAHLKQAGAEAKGPSLTGGHSGAVVMAGTES